MGYKYVKQSNGVSGLLMSLKSDERVVVLVMNRAATVSTRPSVLRGESWSDAARTLSKSLRIF